MLAWLICKVSFGIKMDFLICPTVIAFTVIMTSDTEYRKTDG